MSEDPRTLEEAQKKRYGRWGGNPKGHAYDPGRCAAEAYDTISRIHHQCGRKNGRGPGGLYCYQHAKLFWTEEQREMAKPPVTCKECGEVITELTQVTIREFKDICYPCYTKKPKHVCVDFDGVLARYDGWKGPNCAGSLMPGAAQFLEEVNSLGYRVVIHTTREPKMVWGWLTALDLDSLVHKVTNEKVPAMAYIDDRAICFKGNFTMLLMELKSFAPHWKKGE